MANVREANQNVLSTSGRSAGELFLVSALVLYLELACIRWFPAHVLYLTFFTNTVLLASFLGISLGCLASSRRRALVLWTPVVLLVSMLAAQAIGSQRDTFEQLLRVGNPQAPQLVFFGTEYAANDPTKFVIPIEVVEGVFFIAITLVMVGPGQELGRGLGRVSGRLRAYTLNIVGSLAGIVLFAACSWWELPPVAWFVPIVAAFAYFLFGSVTARARTEPWRILPWAVPCLVGVLAVATWTSGSGRLWSRYYRIDYVPGSRDISVNLIGHQSMSSRSDEGSPRFAYSLPYLLRRDSGGTAFQDVLIIGAGSGNDVSRALAWGARHVDAVEIDPAIQRIGQRDHPDHPYQDPRVSVHIADGRTFLRLSHAHYDLIVFALVDSLVLHSGYSNIRLESFMFTREALADVRAHLKPSGVFVMYNYFREGWIVDRLNQGVQATFGSDPVVMTLPFSDVVEPKANEGFTILLSGDVQPLRQAFDTHGAYWLSARAEPSLATLNGFDVRPTAADQGTWVRFGPARLTPVEGLPDATDDWPFLYLRGPMIPALSARGMAIVGGLAVLFLAGLSRTDRTSRWRFNGRMFFLGAGFMLIETTAVVHMALLFGSTWMVNTIVFAGVLLMILFANLFVARVKPTTLTPYYCALAIVVAAQGIVPLDSLLGLARGWQIVDSCLLAFAPILVAGVIFAMCFKRSTQPDGDFGANVAGAMLGGLTENCSMLLGFRALTIIIGAFYGLSIITGRNGAPRPSQATD